MTFKKSKAKTLVTATVCLLVLAGEASCLSQEVPGRKPDSFMLFQFDLLDETRVIGVPNLVVLNFDLGFESIAIPFDKIRNLQVDKKNRPIDGQSQFFVGLRNGDRYSGRVLDTLVRVKFLAGEVTLPFDQVVSMKWMSSPGDLSNVESPNAIVHFDFANHSKTVVNNAAGDLHHSSLTNVRIRTQKDGRKEVASFQGGGRMAIAHHAALCPKTFSLSAWVKPSAPRDGYAFIAGKSTGSSWNDGYAFAYMQNDPTNIYFYVNGYTAQTTHVAVPSDKWSHLAGTSDGKNVVLYLNGKQVRRIAYPKGQPVKHSSAPFTVGADSGGYHWTGEIDDIALYNRALSQQDVKQLFESQK